MATIRQKKVMGKLVENGGNLYRAFIAAGYSHNYAKNASVSAIKGKGFKELRNKLLPEHLFVTAHSELLNASKIEHMVFPLSMTDEEIIELLHKANCEAKKFMHSETQTHVWFFAADNKARKDAIDMGYKIWGSYAPEEVNLKSGGFSLVELFEQSEARRKKNAAKNK